MVATRYPPGHGDFYTCLERSGFLDEFIATNKDIIFLSNIDNLGATVDERRWHVVLCFPLARGTLLANRHRHLLDAVA
jgi:hypothetical protein